MESTEKMRVYDPVELLDTEVGKAPIAEDAGVVDHDVDRPEAIKSSGNNGFPAFRSADAVIARHRLAPAGVDLCYDGIRSAGAAAGAVDRAAEIVHDYLRSSPSELAGIASTQSATRPGDHSHPPIKSDPVRHCIALVKKVAI